MKFKYSFKVGQKVRVTSAAGRPVGTVIARYKIVIPKSDLPTAQPNHGYLILLPASYMHPLYGVPTSGLPAIEQNLEAV